jgi:uroporphyrin-III C-methyltransferase/precorrin-2 dehydrogenase/sirohydrochlorin ferrochelatase
MLFPMFVDLNGRAALVVGGGGPAAVKAGLLRRAGARVVVVAEAAEGVVLSLAERGEIALRRRAFVPADVNGCALVIAASGDDRLDATVSQAAREAGIPVNVVDRPELASFVMPAIIDRDPLVIAVSSGGTAPVLARRIRAQIEALLPANLGRLARFAERFRSAVRATRRSSAVRRRFWEDFFKGPLSASVLAGDDKQACEGMLALINGPIEASACTGRVQIVGAGPGDADLLTLRAVHALQEADIIVHDRLIGPAVLAYARRDATRIDVGKAAGRHTMAQDEINALLVRLAREGQRVVRLKGGDPLIFGRGGEELDHLRRHGIPAEVVPGITAALGCAAAAGIPLTHRAHAHALTFVTAHGAHGEPDLDWSSLARLNHTLAVYMGAGAAGRMTRRLIAHGLDPEMPAAVIARGTLPDQTVTVGVVQELPLLVAKARQGPALILIGKVVGEMRAEQAAALEERAAG